MESKSIQTAFLFGSNSTHLPLEIQFDLSQHEHSQIAGQRILLPVRSDRAAESPQLVTPQHDGRLHHLPGIFRLDRDGEPALDERQGGDQRLGPAREEIEGDDALGRPGVEADVALQQDADAADAEGVEGVAVVRQQGQLGFGHDVDHGPGEARFGVEEGGVDVLDVDEEVLAGREMLFFLFVFVGVGFGIFDGLVGPAARAAAALISALRRFGIRVDPAVVLLDHVDVGAAGDLGIVGVGVELLGRVDGPGRLLPVGQFGLGKDAAVGIAARCLLHEAVAAALQQQLRGPDLAILQGPVVARDGIEHAGIVVVQIERRDDAVEEEEAGGPADGDREEDGGEGGQDEEPEGDGDRVVERRLANSIAAGLGGGGGFGFGFGHRFFWLVFVNK